MSRRGEQQRPDPGIQSGVGVALRQAFPADGPVTSTINHNAYPPDAAADARMDLMLERLRRLQWGDCESG